MEHTPNGRSQREEQMTQGVQKSFKNNVLVDDGDDDKDEYDITYLEQLYKNKLKTKPKNYATGICAKYSFLLILLFASLYSVN